MVTSEDPHVVDAGVKARALAYARVTLGDVPPARWVLFLHGILGSGGNWRTIARRVVSGLNERDLEAGRAGTWGALLVDLRMHGRSQGFAPPHTVAAAAADLGELDSLGALDGAPIEAVVGHSFGGKVALAYVAARAGDLGDAFIVDSTPSARDFTTPRGSEGTLRVMGTLERLPKTFTSRRAFEDALSAGGLAGDASAGLRQWLATNVEATSDGSYHLRLELPAIRALLADYFVVDAWPVVETPPGRVRVHLIVAGASTVLDAADRARAREAAASHPGRTFYEEIPGAGHWVHVDAPGPLVDILVR